MTTDVRINGDRITGVENQLLHHTINLDQYKSLEKEVFMCNKSVSDVISGQQCIIPVEAVLIDHSTRVEAIEKYVGGTLTQSRRHSHSHRHSHGHGDGHKHGHGHTNHNHSHSQNHSYSTFDFVPNSPSMTSTDFHTTSKNDLATGDLGSSGYRNTNTYTSYAHIGGGVGNSSDNATHVTIEATESNNLSSSLADVHNLLELLGSKIKEHSVILNKVLLHVDQFETYNKSLDDRMGHLEEVNSSVVTPLRQFCDLSGNLSYTNSTNSASGVDIRSIKDVVSTLCEVNKQIRVLRSEHDENHLKLTTIDTGELLL